MEIRVEEFLALLERPAFAVREGQVAASNAAALGRGVYPGRPVAGYLGDAAEEYAAYQGGLLSVRLPLGQVSIRRMDGYDLFLTEPETQMQMERLAYLSQALRDPLGELMASAKWLFPFLEPDEDPTIQHCTAGMNRSLYRLLRLTCELTDAYRLSREDAAMEFARVELTHFAGELYEEAAPLCAAAGLRLELRLPAQRCYAMIDRQQLERAIYNLLSNAMRFSHPDGEILFALDVAGSAARFTVRDDGDGIPAAVLPTVFDRMRQRGPVGDSRWGLGLGLTLARQIAARHGGTLMLQSTEGEGTTATLSIRLDTARPQPGQLKNPVFRYDYTGGYRHSLIELADVLPPELYDSRNLG